MPAPVTMPHSLPPVILHAPTGDSRYALPNGEELSLVDFRGLLVCSLIPVEHPVLREARYVPPFWGKGQGNRPLYEYEIDLPGGITVITDHPQTGFSYFAMRIGLGTYLANVSGGTDGKRTWTMGRGHVQVMHQTAEGYRGYFTIRSINRLLADLGETVGASLRVDSGERMAAVYYAEQTRQAAEREANKPKGLVESALHSGERTFVWTSIGNFYLSPASAYQDAWDAGLLPHQSMTIEALRARGVLCEPTEEERPAQ